MKRLQITEQRRACLGPKRPIIWIPSHWQRVAGKRGDKALTATTTAHGGDVISMYKQML